MERPRALPHPDRPLGQEHPLVAAQGARAPDRSASSPRSARSSRPTAALYRAFLLREELRLLYHLPDPALAPAHLDAWLAWASRSRLTPFVRLARTLRAHRDGILAAIRLGLSNGRLEGLNSKIRLISHRAFGFHSADALIALVYLCCTGITSSCRDELHPQLDRSTAFHEVKANRRRRRSTGDRDVRPILLCRSSKPPDVLFIPNVILLSVKNAD